MRWRGHRWSVGTMLAWTSMVAILGTGCPSSDDNGNDTDASTSAVSDTGDTTAAAMTTAAPMTTAADSTDEGTTASVDTGDSTTEAGVTTDADTSTTAATGGTTEATTDDTGTTSGTTGSTSDTGTTGDPGELACASRCAVEFECTKDWKAEQDCVEACLDNLVEAAAFSPFCEEAWQDLATCQGGLTCPDFELWQNPIELPYPCLDQDQGLEFECKGQ